MPDCLTCGGSKRVLVAEGTSVHVGVRCPDCTTQEDEDARNKAFWDSVGNCTICRQSEGANSGHSSPITPGDHPFTLDPDWKTKAAQEALAAKYPRRAIPPADPVEEALDFLVGWVTSECGSDDHDAMEDAAIKAIRALLADPVATASALEKRGHNA